MARKFLYLFLLPLLLISSNTHVESSEEGLISFDISQTGLNFVKDLLIKRVFSTLIPLKLPKIEKSLQIPVIGKVKMIVSNVTIYRVDVTSSIVRTGEMGVAIIASGATANLSMDWRYSYSTWLLPIDISDRGVASAQVEGMEIGLTLGLENQQGSLKLSIQDCGCYVKFIFIKLNGGASWLYQGLVDAFEGTIASAVEDTISKKITEGMMKIDSQLQSLPKEIPIAGVAQWNITFVNDPILSNSSVGFEINGLFTGKDKNVTSGHYLRNFQTSGSCKRADKMVGISIHEKVLNSASLVYFNANSMQWIVDKVPEQSYLNTARWKYIVPKLYKQFPNDDMTLNITISSPPIVKVINQNVYATIYSDLTVNVLDSGEVIPVACISLVISASGFAEISRNNLAGAVKLSKFATSLEWSKIGNLHMHPIQSVMSAVLRTVIVPYVNLRLMMGFPLPLFHGYKLQNAGIFCIDSCIMLCSDVASS